MTPKEYDAALAKWGLTHEEIAEWLGVTLRTSQRYTGKRSAPYPIPTTTNKLMKLCLKLNIDPEKADQIIAGGRWEVIQKHTEGK